MGPASCVTKKNVDALHLLSWLAVHLKPNANSWCQVSTMLLKCAETVSPMSHKRNDDVSAVGGVGEPPEAAPAEGDADL